MKKKTELKDKLAIGILLLLGVLFCVFVIRQSNAKGYSQESSKKVVAKVNDYNIYQLDIDNIFNQLDGDVSKEKILEDIIDEYVVIGQAENYGIEVTENELQDLILQFQEEQNQTYQRGIEIYGKESFEESLKEQMIFEKVKTFVLKEELNVNERKIEAFKQLKLQAGDQKK